MQQTENAMAQRVLELQQVLSHQGVLVDELLEVLEEERRCLADRDLDGLELQVERKGELFSRIEEAGEHLRALVQGVGAELDLAQADSLSLILPKLEPNQRESLKGIQQKLLTRGAQLKKMLTLNADLLEGSLQTVTGSLDFFRRIFSNSDTYGNAGRMVGGGTRSCIIRREA